MPNRFSCYYSTDPGLSSDLDTDADDLAEFVAKLDLRDAIQVGHSTGGGVVTVVHRDDNQIVTMADSATLSA